MHVRPFRLFHGEPVTVGLESPLEHEFRFLFPGGNSPNDVFVQAGRQAVRLDVSNKTVLVATVDQGFQFVWVARHS